MKHQADVHLHQHHAFAGTAASRLDDEGAGMLAVQQTVGDLVGVDIPGHVGADRPGDVAAARRVSKLRVVGAGAAVQRGIRRADGRARGVVGEGRQRGIGFRTRHGEDVSFAQRIDLAGETCRRLIRQQCARLRAFAAGSEKNAQRNCYQFPSNPRYRHPIEGAS